MKMRIGIVLFGLLFTAAVFVQSAHAAKIVRKRTGTIEIVMPDGTKVKVTEKEPLPEIPSGSTINVLSGEVDVKPSAGFVNVVFGGTSVKVGSTGRVVASFNSKSGKTTFKYGGAVSITKGDTTVNLKKGQRAQIVLDKKTGKVTVKSIKGKIETVTGGVTVIVPRGGAANLNINDKTKKVSIESIEGELEVISETGGITTVADGEELVTRSDEMPGAEPPGEPGAEEPSADEPEDLLAEEPEITEEPAEPEFPEASPILP